MPRHVLVVLALVVLAVAISGCNPIWEAGSEQSATTVTSPTAPTPSSSSPPGSDAIAGASHSVRRVPAGPDG